MGLDMYLQATQFFSGYSFEGQKEKSTFNKIIEAVDCSHFSEHSPSCTVSVTVAYWRKANAIHKWFVDNVQNGEDDCGDYSVSREQLESLISICNKVLQNNDLAEKLLPPQSGFFFGSTEVDQYYFNDLHNTVEQLTKVLKNFPEESFWYFQYHSSW